MALRTGSPPRRKNQPPPLLCLVTGGGIPFSLADRTSIVGGPDTFGQRRHPCADIWRSLALGLFPRKPLTQGDRNGLRHGFAGQPSETARQPIRLGCLDAESHCDNLLDTLS